MITGSHAARARTSRCLWRIIGAFGGAAAERALYRDFPLTRGFDFGPPRLPKAPFDESRYATLHARLEEIGFWEQLVPPASLE